MKKANKILLGLAPLGATLAVLPLAAACGTKKSPRFEQDLDKKIKIATGFSKDGAQFVALQTLVDEYNKTLKDGWQVELATVSGGYDTGTLTKKLEAKDSKELWNIIINYPASASIIASFDMSLNIPTDVYDSFGFAPAFKNVNDTVAGNTKKEKFVVPMSRSTEMITVSKTLLGKLLKALIDDAGVTKAASNTKLIDSYISYFETNTDEANNVNSIWDSAKTTVTEELKAEIKKLVPTLDDTVFQSFEPLINMATAMKKLYSKNNSLYILGFDSLPNAINTMVGASSGGDMSKGYITPDATATTTGGWDYTTFLTNPKSNQAMVFKNAADVLVNGIKNKALWIGGNGAYGSSQLISYKLAMSEGSTAGWDKTFVDSKNAVTRHFVKGTNSGLELSNNLIKGTEAGTAADVATLIQVGTHTNKIFKSNAAKVGKYDYKLPAALDSFEFNNYKDWYFITANENTSVANGNLTIKYGKDNNETVTLDSSKFKELIGLTKGSSKNVTTFYLIDKDSVEVKSISNATVVNEADADWIASPYNKMASESHKAVFQQGPSIIGVHANEEEDKQTVEFIKWFFTQQLPTITVTQQRKGLAPRVETKENITPIDMFNFFGGYVSPTKTFFDSTPEALKLNKANTLAFNQFNLINKGNTNGTYVSAEDVASVKSDSLRKIITTAAIGLFNNSVSKPQDVTFNKFVGSILDSFKSAA